MNTDKYLTFSIALLLSVLTSIADAGIVAPTSTSLTYQGRIVRTDGTALEHSNVSFLFQVTDPTGQCIVYQEHVTGINMKGSKGVFDISIGTGTVSWPTTPSNILEAFNNVSTYTCGACDGYDCNPASTYTPKISDGRLLQVSFYDGTGWRQISPASSIRSVPFAGYAQSAQKLGSYSANDFILKTSSDDFVLKSSVNNSTTCASGKFLTWNAATSTFGCDTRSSNPGTVTGITASLPLSVTDGSSAANISIREASGSQSGALSATDWTTFNSKLGTASSFSGDITGTSSTTKVDKIQSTPVVISGVAANHVLKYSGGNWINSQLTTSDISNLSTVLNDYVTFSKFAICGADKTLTYVSPVGGFICTTIAIAGSQVSGNIAGTASGFTGSLAGDVSGTQASTSVDKIKGVSVSATAPTANQVLQYVGSEWIPKTLSTTPGGSAGGDLSGTYPNPSVASVGTSSAANIHSAELAANAATNLNTASTIVKRDASGNFSAGTITANLTGNVTGTVTGSASLNVLKAGDTMTGNLTFNTNTLGTTYKGTTANTASIQGPSGAITTSYVLRLPTGTPSSAGQALVSDTLGNLSWQSLSSGSVTSVTATSPLSYTTGTTPVISLAGLTGLGSANQILGMNAGGTAYEYKTVNGTSNRITVTHTAGNLTLNAPQDIHNAATPTFSGMTLSGMTTPGFVKNSSTGALTGGNKADLTSDVSGILPVANGGTGVSSFAINRIIASDSTGKLSSITPANSAILTTDTSGVPNFKAASDDIFSQYALRTGRTGGQTLAGGIAANENLILNSTAHSTSGKVILNSTGGSVGIGTTTPSTTLQVNGAIAGRAAVTNSTTTIDFALGNNQFTTLSCQNFKLTNMKDGATYSFVIKGTTSALCSFDAYATGVSGGQPLTVRMPPDHDSTTAGAHTLYTFMIMGNDIYVAWVPGY